ncbi:MAG TPA: hypothetical protein VIT92_09845, partial [Burkholderiaceae bacterium]
MTAHKRTVFLAFLLAASAPAGAAQWSGVLDMRALLHTRGERSWTDEGLGKLRTDSGTPRLHFGQAVLRGDGELADTVSATAVFSAYGDRDSVV